MRNEENYLAGDPERIKRARRLHRAKEGLIHEPGGRCLLCDILDVNVNDVVAVEAVLARAAARETKPGAELVEKEKEENEED